jgi:HlyD family secretion protein
MKVRLLFIATILVLVAALGWGAFRFAKVAVPAAGSDVPTTRVKKGRVTVAVTARGELQGGNSEMLSAPMVGGGDMAITTLRQPGELVEAGDVVVQFDTTQQEFNLREAEADLAEAEQQVARAEAEGLATAEEAKYAVLAADAEVRQAELDMRKNPILPSIVRRQNELALEAAKDRLRQAQQDIRNKETTSVSGIAIQKANQNKAKVMADLA